MEAHLSPDVLAGLQRARTEARHKSKRLRVCVEGQEFPILRMWDGGFALSAEDAMHLRGTVEVRDGARDLYECLIICFEQDGHEITYEVKRLQRADGERPLDFVRPDDAPIALLT